MKQHSRSLFFWFTFIASLLIFALSYRMWKYDFFEYPIAYGQDGTEFLKQIKNIAETGSNWADNFRLGVPFSSNLYGDFPTADMLPIAIIQILILILGNNPFLVANVFIITTFPLIAAVSYIILSKLKIKPWLASLGALTYTFLPYHFIRVNVGHEYLASYYTAPIAIYIAVKLLGSNFALQQYRTFRAKSVILFCLLLIGSVGTGYYAYFSIIIFILSGLINLIRNQNVQALKAGLILSAVTAMVFVINLSPSLLYQYQYGQNNLIQRKPTQIEEFGLRLSRLIMPVHIKQIPILENYLQTYFQNVQHEQYQYLGIFTLLGFFYVIYVLFSRRSSEEDKSLSLLTTAILFIGLSGGLAFFIGSIFGYQIRAYNRLSIYIAFISLYVLLKGIQSIIQKSKKPIRLSIVTTALFCVSMIDQLSYAQAHIQYWSSKNKFDADKSFVNQVETMLPQGSRIFQLPVMTYPEASMACSLDSYDHFAGYLHSNTLKWSFGAVNGRPGFYWQEPIAQLPPDQLVTTLRQNDFAGIYLDKLGCLDFWLWFGQLTKIVGGPSAVSTDQRLFFFTFE